MNNLIQYTEKLKVVLKDGTNYFINKDALDELHRQLETKKFIKIK